MAESSKAKTIVVWVLSVLVGLMFVMTGSQKVMNPAQTGQMFVHWGYPAWFGTVTGIIELVSGALLLVPRVALYAAGLLGATMIGAAITHLKTAGEAGRAVVPLVCLCWSS